MRLLKSNLSKLVFLMDEDRNNLLRTFLDISRAVSDCLNGSVSLFSRSRWLFIEDQIMTIVEIEAINNAERLLLNLKSSWLAIEPQLNRRVVLIFVESFRTTNKRDWYSQRHNFENERGQLLFCVGYTFLVIIASCCYNYYWGSIPDRREKR